MSKKSVNVLVFFAAAFILNQASAATPAENAKANVNANAQKTKSIESQNARNEKKYEILGIDQVDSTSTYAIPLDDSEMEDRIEINTAEKKQVFKLPQAK